MDDLELPPVPQSARTAAQTPPGPSFLLSRKRTHADYDDDPGTSSDPAVFSCDEQAPGAENYVADRRKKRTYKGSWWSRHPVQNGSRKGPKRGEFKRNYDSGIFMASEGTEEPLSSDSFSMEEELMMDQQTASEKDEASMRRTGAIVTSAGSRSTPRVKLPPQTTIIVPKEHQEVCAIVRECLDKGKEDVDLSSMSLSTLPSEITSLQTLSKQDEIVPGMLDTGTNLEPHLRLYLGNNLFIKFPTPILDLRNLRYLSLRQNNLTYIPPTIRELVNLEYLNVAGNSLTELPFEIIELVKFHQLQQLTTHPNPWKQVGTSAELIPGWDLLHEVPLTGDHFFRHASSQHHPESDSMVERHFKSAPSLTEMVLRQLSKIDPLQKINIRGLMPPDSPTSVLRNLDTLTHRPGQRCTTCKRPLVLAGKEWIEWWYVLVDAYELWTEGPPVPFRRVQCWKGCRGTAANWMTGDERR
ncbi:hypothetical protein A1O3_01077 [Capronia epimyces CBS 606.96]|uniref:Uncharacterized protein n=1 Tax=Capronia epimyces CBS 606.96 TaxID=1182542 RepID=W9YS90_9EURO|nr:uncharacterized protein A1O3_01077 [Capronia epimyces CBS 606.96]EXJ92525.1 hypothetical protein A1O3_01077 [Capronia epimyces CBS 606.96]